MKLQLYLLVTLLADVVASDESCLGRCENGFDHQKTCQCDSMCKYYKSCCSDYVVTCGMITRGDTFELAEDDDGDDYNVNSVPGSTRAPRPSSQAQTFPPSGPLKDFNHKPHKQPDATLEMTRPPQQNKDVLGTSQTQVLLTDAQIHEVHATTETLKSDSVVQTTVSPVITTPTQTPDPDADKCSGRPFDSFMQLKNGSIYAFRGLYFFELDQRSVVPGYPKLIQDVWGISGPIDAAFTRVNCQGKTYIFKGTKYWRFDDGVLDDDYPRDISVGFDKIPDHVDAAFALPASSHNGKERVYFFKGEQYYTYQFLHQPSHEECIKMSERSPSTLFRRYTDVYHSNYEPFFTELFSGLPQHHDHHHFINRDWKGLRAPVDAALAGRIYVTSPRSLRRRVGYQSNQQWGHQQYQQNGQQWSQRRRSRSPFWGSMAEQGMKMGQGFAERGMEMGLRLAERRMELEEKLGRDWGRRWDQDWDQDRRWDQDWDQDRRWDQDWDQDRQRDNQWQNNRGNYDSRYGGWYWDRFQQQMPIQSVYFFKGDLYYRADLRTKRVDPALPPYPRPIAKYWLGCSNSTRAERK